jgi:hypothetical protein
MRTRDGNAGTFSCHSRGATKIVQFSGGPEIIRKEYLESPHGLSSPYLCRVAVMRSTFVSVSDPPSLATVRVTV